jgi:hypothetical protein
MSGLGQSSIFTASVIKFAPAPLYPTYNRYKLPVSFLEQ